MNVPEVNANFTPDEFDDKYLKMELAVPRYGEGSDFARVTKRLREKGGPPISRAQNNPILYTRMYEVEYKHVTNICLMPMQ